MTQVEQAVVWLSENPLFHIDMLESIRRGNAELIEVTNMGVLLLDNPSGTYMISTEDAETANRMIQKVEKADLFVGHQDFYREKLMRKFGYQKKMECWQAVYLQKVPLSQPCHDVKMKRMDSTYLSFVIKHYSNHLDEEYLLDRLNKGTIFGAFVKDELAGFVGSHEEGSIGLLEVLPQYQRRGIAVALESFMVNGMLKEGKVPYGQVVVGNNASIALQKKLGLSISDKTVYWLM